MWAILSRILNDPVSVYLLAGDILATVAVGFGIIWEHGPSEVRSVANKLVIGGIVAETLCTALLFAWDANIIGDQNDKIIVLEKRIAPRVIPPEVISEGIVSLGHFKGQPFDISVTEGAEQIRLMNQIRAMLESAGWVRVKHPLEGPIVISIQGGPAARILTDFVGLGVEINQSRISEMGGALSALAVVLRKAIPDTIANAAPAMDGTAPPNAIHLAVGTKP